MRTLINAAMVAAGLTCAASGAGFGAAQAGTEPFVGEIMMVGDALCPANWAEANGQLLPVAAHRALFTLYRDTFGGDGVTTFGLPDLRGRMPVNVTEGPGRPVRRLGRLGWTEAVALKKDGAALSASDAMAMLASPAAAGDLPPRGAQASHARAAAPDTANPYLMLRYCVAVQASRPARP